MANSEHTRATMRDLEAACARAQNLALCLIEAGSADPDHPPAWVNQFRQEIDALCDAADRFICAVNGVHS